MYSMVTVPCQGGNLFFTGGCGAMFSNPKSDLTRRELQLALSQVRQHLVAGFEEGKVKLRKVQLLQSQQRGSEVPGIAALIIP